jgi:hypothetical protein
MKFHEIGAKIIKQTCPCKIRELQNIKWHKKILYI